MVMMLVGVSWYAYIVSSMSSIMSSFDAQNKAIREKMTCVNEFVRTAKLPKDLSKQVRDFYEFKLARSQHSFLMSSNYDVDELLDELGSGLRADVLLYMDRNLISAIPFLQNKVPQFVADCISMFQPMVFQADDYICKENTQADEMYFLVKGRAGIYYGVFQPLDTCKQHYRYQQTTILHLYSSHATSRMTVPLLDILENTSLMSFIHIHILLGILENTFISHAILSNHCHQLYN